MRVRSLSSIDRIPAFAARCLLLLLSHFVEPERWVRVVLVCLRLAVARRIVRPEELVRDRTWCCCLRTTNATPESSCGRCFVIVPGTLMTSYGILAQVVTCVTNDSIIPTILSILRLRVPREDLYGAITAGTDHPSAVSRPNHSAHTLTTHDSMIGDLLRAVSLLKGPEAQGRIVTTRDKFATIRR